MVLSKIIFYLLQDGIVTPSENMFTSATSAASCGPYHPQ